MVEMSSIPGGTLTSLYFLAGSAVLVAGGVIGSKITKLLNDSDLEKIEGDDGENGFTISTSAQTRGVSGMLASYGQEKKKRKALSDGKVRWHLLGSSFEKPRYITPERKGGGNIPEYKHDGEVYFFPSDAALPSEGNGVPVVIHRKGESEPLYLPDSWGESIDAKALAEYLTNRVTSDNPEDGKGGLLGLGFLADMSPQEIMQYGILAIAGFFVVMEVLGT